MTQPPIVCAGRAVDDAGQPLGDPCGRRPPAPHGRDPADVARAAGWRLSPPRPDGSVDAMCPRCARPDPDLVKLLRDLR